MGFWAKIRSIFGGKKESLEDWSKTMDEIAKAEKAVDAERERQIEVGKDTMSAEQGEIYIKNAYRAAEGCNKYLDRRFSEQMAIFDRIMHPRPSLLERIRRLFNKKGHITLVSEEEINPCIEDIMNGKIK